jgi:hypothetical protein
MILSLSWISSESKEIFVSSKNLLKMKFINFISFIFIFNLEQMN